MITPGTLSARLAKSVRLTARCWVANAIGALARMEALLSGSLPPAIADSLPDRFGNAIQTEGVCDAEATWVSCVPFAGALTCVDHKCRCAKPNR